MRTVLHFALFAFLAVASFFILGSAPLALEGERADFLTGTLRRADGQPVPNARFRLAVQDRAGNELAATQDVDVTGQYALRVPPTAEELRVVAFAHVAYNGATYRLEMEPVGGAHLATAYPGEAAVKDFRLRLGGPRTLTQIAHDGRATWGESVGVTIVGEGRLMQPGDAIEVTLRPRGPLVDGTTGLPVTERIAYDALGSPGAAVRDVPIGLYLASARLTTAGGASRAVRLAAHWPARDEDLREELAVQFEPGDRMSAGAVRPLRVWVHPSPPARQIAGADGGLQ